MAERIQRRRTKGWTMPEGAVYVGRPTWWGNPFTVGATLPEPWSELTWTGETVRDRAEAVELFKLWAADQPGYADRVRAELAGKALACWCPLDAPCHADVLLVLANPMDHDNRDRAH